MTASHLELVPEPDGRVAIYEDGILLGRARDQAHADDWAVRWEQNMNDLAGLAWTVADAIWARLSPEDRRYFSEPRPDQIERMKQAA